MRSSAEVLADLVPPPGPGPDPRLCVGCQTWNDTPDVGECSNCTEVRRSLGHRALPLSVITLYRKPSQLRDWLTYYKACPEEGLPPEPTYAAVIEDLVADFFDANADALRIATGGFDALAVVPSTSNPPPHPLELVLDAALGPGATVRLLSRGDGALGFRQPSASGYVVSAPRPPRRVVLVDDVYTTGSRINSAAAAARTANVDIVGALVLARRVNPAYSPDASDFWTRQSALSFSFRSSPFIQAVHR